MKLTPNQVKATQLTAEGLGTNEVAEAMGIARGTVEKTLQNARLRIGARTVAHLVAIAMTRGEIHPLSEEHVAQAVGRGRKPG